MNLESLLQELNQLKGVISVESELLEQGVQRITIKSEKKIDYDTHHAGNRCLMAGLRWRVIRIVSEHPPLAPLRKYHSDKPDSLHNGPIVKSPPEGEPCWMLELDFSMPD